MKTIRKRINIVARKNAKRFIDDTAGSILPVSALMLGTIVVSMGAALDISQKTQAKSALVSAIDSAALSAAKSYDGENRNLTDEQLQELRTSEQAELQRLAGIFAKANLNFSKLGLDPNSFHITADEPIQELTNEARILTVKVRAQVNFQSAVARAFNIGRITLSTSTTATKSFPLNREIVLALDTTGSMADTIPSDTRTKIQGLRDAVMAMFDTLSGRDPTKNYTTTELNNIIIPSDIKIGIIPYSENVNLTAAASTGGYENLLESDQFDVPSGLETFVLSPGSIDHWTGCIRERDTDRTISGFDPNNLATPATAFDLLDIPAGSAGPDGTIAPKWQPLVTRPVAFRTKQSDGSWVVHTPWNWYSQAGAPPVYAQRDSSSQNYYMTNTPFAVSYPYGIPSYNYSAVGPNINIFCPSPSLAFQTNIKRSTMNTYLNRLSPAGNTMSNLGLAWANRMISPQKPLTGGTAYGEKGTQKILVLMTDGYITADAYTLDQVNAFGNSVERRVRDTTDSSEVQRAFEQRLAMTCQAAKWPRGYVGSSPAIRLFVVLFGLTDSEVSAKRSLYERCATPGDFIAAKNNKELADAFKRIGSSDLRISQ